MSQRARSVLVLFFYTVAVSLCAAPRLAPCLVLGDHRTREEFQKPRYTRSCMTKYATRLLCITAEAKAEPIPHTQPNLNSLGHLGNSNRGRANSAAACTAHAAQRARASPASCFTWMSRQPLPPLPATTTSPTTHHPPGPKCRRGELYPAPRRRVASPNHQVSRLLRTTRPEEGRAAVKGRLLLLWMPSRAG